MQRFLIDRQSISRDNIILEGDLAHQIRNVLRLQSGCQIVTFDNSGWEYTVTIDKVDRKQVTGTICHRRKAIEPAIKITLYQALLKSDHFEFVLQKCTEIGISAFVPIACERCVARKPSPGKIERWKNIIREATEQSGRAVLPILRTAISLDEACNHSDDLSLIAEMVSGSLKLSEVLRTDFPGTKPAAVNIFIGPEGGFTGEELELAQRCGIHRIALGPHVLRAETAGLVAATAILYEYGELDRPPASIEL